MLGVLKRLALGLSVCGLLTLGSQVFAGQPTQQASRSAASVVIDVVMAPGNALVGQVLTKERQPAAKTRVSVRLGRKEVAATTTDERGQFRVAGLQPGLYQVVAADGFGLFRLWSPKVAPPSARSKALVVSGAMVVRAQSAYGVGYTDSGEVLYDENGVPYGEVRVMDPNVAYCEGSGGFLGGIDPLILTTTGAAVAGVVLGAVAVHEINEVEDEVAKIPKSP